MRFLFLLILIAGIGLGIGYPWAVQNFSGEEIARHSVYERGQGYSSVVVPLSAEQAPVRVFVEMTSLGSRNLTGDQTVLTLTATINRRTVLANTLTFSHSEPRPDTPQSGGMIYGDDAGVIDPVETGDYEFVVGPGDADTIEMRSATLILRAHVLSYDARATPIGFVLMAIGFIGLVLSLARGSRRNRNEPPAAPPGPKWGR